MRVLLQLNVVLFFITFLWTTAVHADESLTLQRDGHWLVIQGDHLPEKEIRINYLEAYCRPNSTEADWVSHTVIPHKSKLVSLSEDSKVLKLTDKLSDGVIVQHTITAGDDEVDFHLVAHNPTEIESEAHWAQPCVRLGPFTGFDSDSKEIDDYLPKCFLFLDGKMSRMPTNHWAKTARYTPGQVWCPVDVPRSDVNPRPLSNDVPSHGLIGAFSKDERWMFATAWHPYQELFQGVARCLHSDFRIGGLAPGETKTIRGKIYIVAANPEMLLQRYENDFPEHSASTNDIFAANRRLGQGINLGNFLEVPRRDNWGVQIHHDHLQLIKQAGFDSIRLPVKWSDYAAKESPYTIEPEFFARVDTWLDRAEREQLNVVLNIHHYDDLDKHPETHTERFETIWRQIAERYKSRGSWLYFELDNEPHEQLNDHWNAILLRGLSAVRTSNPTRPVIVGPPNWNGIWALPQLKLPDDPNLIVTVHMYNPHGFTHQGASWASEEVQSIRDRKWGTKEERAALQAEIQQAAQWGREHHRPIYLGEFGAYSAAPMESRVRWMNAVAEAAEAHQMSWAYWEFAAGFGLYDLQKGKWREELLGALLRANE